MRSPRGGIAFVLLPTFEGLMRGFNIAVFGIPPIALGPVLVITLPATGRKSCSRRDERLLSDHGDDTPGTARYRPAANRCDPQLWRRRGRGAALAALAFLPAGILERLARCGAGRHFGAILAEFGSGARWGLAPSYWARSAAAIRRASGHRLSATLMAAFAYGLCCAARPPLQRVDDGGDHRHGTIETKTPSAEPHASCKCRWPSPR